MHSRPVRNVQDPVGHEDSSPASVEDAKFESDRGVIIGPAADAGFEATRRRKSGNAGECGIRGDSENHLSGAAEE
jgi:hypothetical protein